MSKPSRPSFFFGFASTYVCPCASRYGYSYRRLFVIMRAEPPPSASQDEKVRENEKRTRERHRAVVRVGARARSRESEAAIQWPFFGGWGGGDHQRLAFSPPGEPGPAHGRFVPLSKSHSFCFFSIRSARSHSAGCDWTFSGLGLPVAVWRFPFLMPLLSTHQHHHFPSFVPASLVLSSGPPFQVSTRKGNGLINSPLPGRMGVEASGAKTDAAAILVAPLHEPGRGSGMASIQVQDTRRGEGLYPSSSVLARAPVQYTAATAPNLDETRY